MCLLYSYINFYYIDSSSLIWKYNFTVESLSLKTSHALYAKTIVYKVNVWNASKNQ